MAVYAESGRVMSVYFNEIVRPVLERFPETHLEALEWLEMQLPARQPRMLTPAEFAAQRRKHPESVRRFCRQGRIPGANNETGSWLIPEDARVLPARREEPLDMTRRRRTRPTKTSAGDALREMARAA